MSRRGVVRRMAVAVVLVVFVALALAAPVGAGSNGQQVKFRVTRGYTVVDATVIGTNQKGVQEVWQAKQCEYGVYSVCPRSVQTKGWWWIGPVTVSFTIVAGAPRFADGTVLQAACAGEVPKNQLLGNVYTVTFDPQTNTCK